ncbi:MAG: RluA family pseudouridine synthase [Bacteroidales bacterium]
MPNIDKFEHFRLVVDKGQSATRIDKFISTHLEHTSRNRIQQAIDAKYVEINGQIVKANCKVKPLDIITINLPYERHEFSIVPQDIPLDIRYEDNDVLVVYKPAGMVVHPGAGNFDGTLINALAFYLHLNPVSTKIEDGQKSVSEEDQRMGVLVHRIDKDTSGLLLVAKNENAQLKLAKQFFDHSINRKYVAIVWGDLENDEGIIEGNIGRDPNDRLKFKVFADGSEGKTAVTHYKVLKRFGYVTLVECILETGRTHQIRVHMNYIGHPIFNDEKYGGDRIRKGAIYTKYKQFIKNCFKLLPHQALHAKTLGFIHPATGKHILINSNIPSDMVAVLDKFDIFARNSKEILE